MSSPVRSLADPMSTYNTSRRFFQEQRDIRDAERRAKVNKELEKALSSSSEDESECKCKCKQKQLSQRVIEHKKARRKQLEKWDKKNREDWEAFDRKIDKSFECVIL